MPTIDRTYGYVHIAGPTWSPEVTMPWRVIACGDQVWHVDAVAERPANTQAWQLVLAFRVAGARAKQVWTPYPLEATSRSSLFIQAERIPDRALSNFLAERLT
jgi:hypothetical protein